MDPLLEKKFISTKAASDISGYNSDYLARLCRSGKIVGTQIGRTWIVSQESLEEFVKSQDERKQELREQLSEARGKEYRHAQSPVAVTVRSLSPMFKTIAAGSSGVSEYLTHPAKLSSFQKQGTAVLGALVVLLIGITVAQAAPLATLAQRSFDTVFAVSDGLHAIAYEAIANADARAPHEFAAAASSNYPFTNIATTSTASATSDRYSHILASAFTHVSPIALSPSSRPRSSVDAFSFHTSPITGSTHFAQESLFKNIHSPADASVALARFEEQSYVGIGANLYVGIEKGLSAYLNVIQSSGNATLALGTTIRDIGTRMPLVLAENEIGAVRAWVDASKNILHAYSDGVYAWVNTTPAVSTTLAMAEYQGVYNAGSTLATIAGNTPAAIVSGYKQGMDAWVNGTPVIATGIVQNEIAVGAGVTDSVALALNAEKSAVHAGADLAYGLYQKGASALVIAPNDLSSRVATLRANAEDAWLGVLGNSSHDLTTQLAASIIPSSAIALGEQTAVMTYQALHGLFTTATGTIAYLFGARPNVATAPAPTVVTVPTKPAATAPVAASSTYITNNTTHATNITYVTQSSGVSTSYVDAAIKSAVDALRSTFAMMIIDQVDAVVNPITRGITENSLAISEIQKYTNIAIHNSSFDNGTITNSSLSNVAISSSTFSGTTVTTGDLVVTGSSTFGGPFSAASTTVNGSLTVNGDATLTGTTTLNNATITNANLTNLTVSATTTTGGLSIGSLNGFLKATAGAISTSLINLSSDVSNMLPVLNGGTGTSSFATNGVLYGNGTNNLLTTTQGGANTILVANNGAPSFSSAITVGTSINTPYLSTTNASTTNLTVAGNLYVPGSVASNLIPLTNNTYDLGTPELYYHNAFIDTLTVNNISAASTSIAGTVSPTFTLNSGNTTNDTVNMALIFFRGLATPNAVLAWDSVNKYFNFNMLANFAAGATTTQFTSTGNTYLATAGGNVGIGTINPSNFKLQVAGNIGPDANATYDLGSSSNFFANAYVNAFRLGTPSNFTTLQLAEIGQSGNGSFRIKSSYGYWLNVAPTARTDQATLAVGNGPWDNTTAGFFSGASAGTQIGVNAASGFTGNLIDLQTAGSSKFLVTGGGNVGIGTSSPWASLSVQVKNANGIGYLMTGTALDASVDNQAGVALVLSHNSSGNRQFTLADSQNGNGVRFAEGVIDGYNYVTNTRQNLGLGTNTTNVTITGGTNAASGTYFMGTTGFVGIGTSTPFAQLSVMAGSDYLSHPASTLFAIGSSSAGTATSTLFSVDNTGFTRIIQLGNTPAFEVDQNGVSGRVMRIDNNGMTFNTTGTFGSNTWNNHAMLELYGASNALTRAGLYYQGPSGSTGDAFDYASSTGTILADVNSLGGAYFAGNVGIGTTTPLDQLGVAGNAQVGALNVTGGNLTQYYSAGGLAVTGGSGGVSSILQAYSSSGGTGKGLSLNPNGGNVGIGSTTNPVSRLTTFGAGANTVAVNLINTNNFSIASLAEDGGESGNLNVNNSTGTTMVQISGHSGGFGGTGSSISILGSTAMNGSTQQYNAISVTPNINQSGTSGYTGLLINPTETSVGSGAKYLADFQVGGVDKFNVTDAGNVGIGTTSPYANLSVQNNYGSNNSTLFAISSSTNAGGTTSSALFSVNATGTTTISGGLAVAGGRNTDNNGNVNLGVGLGTAKCGLYVADNFNGQCATTGALIGADMVNDANYANYNVVALAKGNNTQGFTPANGQNAVLSSILSNSAGSTDAGGIYSKIFTVTSPNTGTAYAFYAKNQVQGTQLTNYVGFESNGQFSTSGSTIVNQYDFKADDFAVLSSGTTTNRYGLFLNQTASATTGNYGVYQVNTGITNYFAGNVGIGTSTPYANLSIHANNGSTNTTLFAIGSSTASATTTLFSVDNTGSANIANTLTVTNGITSNNNINLSLGRVIAWGPATQIQGSPSSDGALHFFTNSVDHFDILNNGNVGIGTTTPWGLLSVNPNGVTGPSFVIGSSTSTSLLVTNGGQVLLGESAPNNTSTTFEIKSPNTPTAATRVFAVYDSTNIERTRLLSNGIQTWNLFSGGAERGNITYGTPANLPGIDLSGPSTGTGRISLLDSAQGGLLFGAATSTGSVNTYAVLTGAGNFGIGTTSPTSKLQVEGINNVTGGITLSSTAGTVSGNRFAIYTLGNYGTAFQNLVSNGSTQFLNSSGAANLYIDQATGDVGIGTTAPLATLDVAGSARVNSLVFTASSTDYSTFTSYGGFNGYINASGGLGTAGIQRLTQGGNLVNLGSVQGGQLALTTGGTFAAATNYTTGAAPQGVAIGDLNGDGKADIVTADGNVPNVTVSINNGDGTFAAAVGYTTGSNPTGVAIGDLNGDGKADLVVANNSSGTVSVFINNGNGTFVAKVDYTVGAYGVAIGDVNGDGRADIVTANNGSANVSVLLNNGNGTFASAVNYTTGTTPLSVVIADLNGDGKADLAVANDSSSVSATSISVLLNNGNGTFAAKTDYTTGVDTRSIGAGDLNGDGKADLVVTNYGPGTGTTASVFLNNGNGTFAAKVDYTTGSNPRAVAIADMNGDGKPDLAIANFNGNSVSVLLNVGNGTFNTNVDYAVGTAPQGVAVGDLNGDGKADIVSANRSSTNISILLNTPTSLLYASATSGSTFGHVGIGTTSPYAQLSIWGSSSTLGNAFEAVNNASTTLFTIQNAGRIGVASTTPWGLLSINPNALGSGVPEFVIGSSTATHFLVDGAGNIGIGTTTPGSLLSIQGIANFTTATSTFNSTGGINLKNGCYAVNGVCLGSGGSGGVGAGTIGQFGYYAANGTNLTATSSIFLATNGNVGIGTTTPWARLSVDTSNLAAGVPEFSVGSSTRQDFVITQAGYVGIGTTTPGTFLSIQQPNGTSGDLPYAITAYGGIAPNSSHGGGFLFQAGNDGTNSWGGGLDIGGAGFNGLDTNLWAASSQNNGSPGWLGLTAGNGINNQGGSTYISGGNSSNSTGGNLYLLGGTGTTNGNIFLGIDADGTTLRGRVGVATTTPWGLFSINPAAGNTGTGPEFVIGSSTATHFIVTNGGRVGVGTTTPWGLLSVNANRLAAGVPQFVVGSSTGTNLIVANNGNVGVGTTTPWAQLSVNPNGITGPAFVIGSSTATKFIVSSTGNVGVGSTTPWAQLSINPNALAAGTPFFAVGSSTATNFIVSSTGNVGIGTTTPGSLLSIGNTGGINFSLATSTFSTTGGINLASGCYAVNGVCLGSGGVGAGTIGQFPYYSANGTSVTATSTLFLAANGYIGFGTTTPLAALDVEAVAQGTAPIATNDGTGGTITTYTSGNYIYKVHTFTSSGTFVAPTSGTSTVQMLVVAGGGGGGSVQGGGGGGAGGVLQGLSSITGGSSYTITIGAGGAGAASASVTGTSGGNSTFNGLTAAGGGGGGSGGPTTGLNGGSGGGAGNNNANPTTGGSASPAGQGNAGGSVSGTAYQGGAYPGGGGGGAGGPGVGPTTGCTVPNGGVGTTTSISGASVIYAGGGGAGVLIGSGGCAISAGAGGAGGGGAGSQGTTNPIAGTPNTGGGGGGGGDDQGIARLAPGAVGGSGIVIVAYRITYSPPIIAGLFNNGNVGIGTITPGANLTIKGTTAGQNLLQITTNVNPNILTVDQNGLTGINVGVGGWTGNAQMSVSSPGMTSSNYWGLSADILNGGSGAGGAILADTMTTAASLMTLYYNHATFVGSITTNGTGVTYGTASDRRLKENITPTTAGLATLMQIPVDDFNFISDSNSHQQGYIAQDLYNYYPIAVHVGGADPQTNPWSVDYGRLTPLIMSSVQQLATGYSLNNTSASSTVASWYAGVSAPAIAVDSAGNVGIGTGNSASTTLSSKIVVNGDASILGTVYGTNFVATGAGANFATMYGSIAVGSTTAASALSADGTGVNLYKLATFALTGVQQLAAQQQDLATRTDAIGTEVDRLSARVAALESGATAGLQNATSTNSSGGGSLLSATTTQLASALESFGFLLQNGIAQFNTLVVRNLVFSKDSNGASAAGSGTVLAGNTTVEIDNPDMLATSQVSVTLTAPLTGNWYVSGKQDGKFRVTLSAAQTADVTFDYIIVQTQGQIATSTPTGYVGSPFSWINALFGGSSSSTSGSSGGQVSAGIGGSTVGTGTTSGTGTSTTGTTSGGTASSTPAGAPTVILNGAPAISLNVNDAFIDPGATAHDAAGADISASIHESGSVDTATPGIYTLTYTATDGAGATGSASRVVTVSAGGTVSGGSSTTDPTTTTTSSTTLAPPATTTTTDPNISTTPTTPTQ